MYQTRIYPESTGGVHLTCGDSGVGDINCQNDDIYYAGSSLLIYCNGQCDGMNVYCGSFDPPGDTYSLNDMDGGTVSCHIYNQYGYADNNIYFYCKGSNVGTCTFRHIKAGITSSTLECDIGSDALDTCGYSCDTSSSCGSTNELLCYPGSVCSNTCNLGCDGVSQSQPTTANPTSCLFLYFIIYIITYLLTI